jgi:hypothetical protein
MDPRPAPETTQATGPCADLRSRAESACSESARLKVLAREAAIALQAATRDFTRAAGDLQDAEAAGDANRASEAKMAARAAYQEQMGAATTVLERQVAVTEWLRVIDRINVRSRSADEMLGRAHAAFVRCQKAMVEAERLAGARRVRAEAAAHECIEARQRQAVCEEETGATLTSGAIGALLAIDTLGADAEPEDGHGRVRTTADGVSPKQVALAVGPLLAELLFEGDRAVMSWLANELAELGSRPPSHYLLQLQELLDAVELAAADRQYLVFDARHPMWGQFSQAECRIIAGALSDLGFRKDPRDGWRDGRVPAANDLAIALAYAGFDARRVRAMPTTTQSCRELASGISLSPLELVRDLAPELTIRELVEVLGRRADALDDLWDDWGRLRPLLLTEASAVLNPEPA